MRKILWLGLICTNFLFAQVKYTQADIKDVFDKVIYYRGFEYGQSLKTMGLKLNTDVFKRAMQVAVSGENPVYTEEEMTNFIIKFQELKASASEKKEADDEAKKQTDNLVDKVSYSIGYQYCFQMVMQGFKVKPDIFIYAMNSGLYGENPVFTIEQMKKFEEDFQTEKEKEFRTVADKHKKDGENFLSENSKKKGVITTKSGLQYKIISKGIGKKPGETDKVKAHYIGKLLDGKEFDNSYKNGAALEFKLNQVIPAWIEALQLMQEGDKFELYVPYKLAYGENGNMPVIPPCATLIFEVELIEVLK